jgi:hypothetical protein
MTRSQACALVLALLQPVGCRHGETDPSAGPREGPGLTARMYVLRNVAGQRLPAALVDNEHATIIALADTLWLEADGTGLEVSTERSTDKGSGTPPVVGRYERPFSYDTDRDRITVSFECNDVIIRSCVAPPHLRGLLTDASLVLDHALHYRTPLHYERVRQ